MSGSAASPDVVAQLVETMRTLAGPHPGFRPVHAKGIACSGTGGDAVTIGQVCALHFGGVASTSTRSNRVSNRDYRKARRASGSKRFL
jgi:hypothetical protein